MAYNGMPTLPSVSQATLSITASAYSSFATPAITVPFPSVYGGQIQLAYTFTSTATFAATRIPTTLGGAAATAGVHSINEAASAAGYRTHDYGASGGGSSWPVWATAVIASVGGAAILVLLAGLWCWRLRKKQRARRVDAGGGGAAAAYAAGDRGGKRGKKGVQMHQGGGAYREEKFADVGRGGERDPRVPAGAMGATLAPSRGTDSRSRSRQSGYDSSGGSSYPPPASAGSRAASSTSPSRTRARDLAALGINRPTSTTPSSHDPSPSALYPAFALPKTARHSQHDPRTSHHERNFSGSSDHSFLPAPAPGFAFVEGPRAHSGEKHYSTPPPTGRPNTTWDDSPSGLDSPARLLTFNGTPNNGTVPLPAEMFEGSPSGSTFTVSTRGTGGAGYRWDGGGDEPMPEPAAVSAALGRAMLQPHPAEPMPIGVAVGTPEDAARWSQSGHSHDYRYSPGAGGGGTGYQDRDHYGYDERSTTPSYAPNLPSHLFQHDGDGTSSNSHSQYTASRAPSRAATIVQSQPQQHQSGAFLAAHPLPGGGGREGGGRSTTPLGEPEGYDGGGGMSRSTTYATADEDG
jgi:hypothetical protein